VQDSKSGQEKLRELQTMKIRVDQIIKWDKIFREVPEMITIRNLMGILQMSYRSSLRWAHKHIPRGGMVKAGRHYLVALWALKLALDPKRRCESCGRPWSQQEEDSDEGG